MAPNISQNVLASSSIAMVLECCGAGQDEYLREGVVGGGVVGRCHFRGATPNVCASTLILFRLQDAKS